MDKEKSKLKASLFYRAGTYKDVLKLTELWEAMMKRLKIPGHEYNEDEKKKFFVSMTQRLAHPDTLYRVFVVETNRRVVGFISGGVSYAEYGITNCAVIEHLYVDPQWRGGEVPRLLNKKIEASFKQMGVNKIKLHSSRLVTPVVWEDFGYKPMFLTMLKEVG